VNGNNDDKPAYMVICGTMLGEIDPEYTRRAKAVVIKTDATPIAGGLVDTEQVELLEGELPPGSTFFAIEQFRNKAAVNEFYYSEEYQSAIPFRKDSMQIKFAVVVEGL
jgi:uncharacterized protein (DUF1330 family)